ncbi:unnamed protein product [Chironomus riparius]|uniref:Uncharacterized protein n=1 Tax=Chironomus riparius TaxID=315576 RepID=A0A9N9WT73_9DIPT|nr:unnamed protein product [Chironomus riparius]
MYGIKSIHAMTFYVSIDQEAVLVKGKEKQMSVKKKFKAIILRITSLAPQKTSRQSDY